MIKYDWRLHRIWTRHVDARKFRNVSIPSSLSKALEHAGLGLEILPRSHEYHATPHGKYGL